MGKIKDVDLTGESSGPYDLILAAHTKPSGEKIFLRVQIKTISGTSLTLGGGSRDGIDREYKSGVKTYKYSEEHNELIFGVDKENLDIYIFPTRLASKYGTSISKKNIEVCKNNWEILMNWNE